MAFCANCGSPVEGRFCPKCGSPAGAAGGPPASQPLAGAGLTDNAASALCYVLGFVTGIIFLVMAPYNQNRTIRFHAFQSIFLSVAWFVVWFALDILLGLMHMAGVFGVFFLSPLIGLGFFVLWIYMIGMAYQGKQVLVPVIGPLAQQQA